MGRRSEVLTFDCELCEAEIDLQHVSSHEHGHRCGREDIQWDEFPDVSYSSEFIPWNGTCEVCGRRVYDCYVPEGPLYNIRTHARI